MKKYKYTALNINKKKFTGSFLAENEENLRVQLAEQNLFLVSCKEDKQTSPNAFFSLTGKVKMGEITSFSRQFAIMINSGIPILDCLLVLKNQSYTGFFKKILNIVHEDVKVGILLSDALKKHKKVFPEFFYNMIGVGEIAGKLDVVLNNLADYYENDVKLKKKVKAAITYPIVLAIMLVGVVSIMLLFVVPTFQESLEDLGVTPPTLTQIVFDMSDFLKANGMNLLAGVVVIALLLYVYSTTKKGKLVFSKIAFRMPGFGKVVMNINASRFARGFGLLLYSGLDAVDAMEVMANVIGNKYMAAEFRKAIDDVRQGDTMTLAFDRYNIFPKILIQMIAIGEKSGEIDDVLMRSSTFFDNQVESSITTLSSILQPVMLVVMAVVIIIMFIAVYSPMLGIMTDL